MRSIRELEPEQISCVDDKLNIFEATTGDFTFTVRQPRRKDYGEHLRAWRKLSHYTLERYKRKYSPERLYDNKYRCKFPLYHGSVPGWVPLIMVVGDEIVGFADMYFRYGIDFQIHKIADDEVGCSMNLCTLDKYHGLGIGSYYGNISLFIAKHFGADYALGYTSFKKGMFNIRMKDNWEYIARRGDYAVIRKKL